MLFACGRGDVHFKIMWPLAVCLAVVIIYLLKKILDDRTYAYWRKRGVDVPDFSYIAGNLSETLRMKKSAPEVCANVYQKYEGYNYVGFYKFLTPAFVVRSPELVKDILIKDFQSFYDNDYFVHIKTDPVVGRNPFLLRGSAWKTTRSLLSPNYSTSKVKGLIPFVLANEVKLREYLTGKCTEEITMDAKELASRFTCENFASCSVGFNGGCFNEPESEFMTMGNRFNAPTLTNAWKSFAMLICPFLSKILHVRFFDKVLSDFTGRIIDESLELRKGETRSDLLANFDAVRKKVGDESVFGLEDVKAHVGGFLFDGFETSSIALSYALVELAANQAAQEALKSEIDEFFGDHEEISYENIQEMQYLNGVFQETLRKHVPLPLLVKRCTKTYKLPPMMQETTDSNAGVTIEPGTVAIIPVYALHYDEQHFPEPEKFQPERFLGGDTITKGTYLPFGDGPRICLGMKFAIMQVKIAIVSIVRNFQLTLNKKTEMPLRIDPLSFFMAPHCQLLVDIKKRD